MASSNQSSIRKGASDLGQRNIALIVMFLVIIGALVWYYLALQPMQERIKELQEDIVGLEGEIREVERARDEIQGIEESLAKEQEKWKAFLEELPQQHEIAQLIEDLRLFAVNNDLRLLDINATNSSGNSNIPNVAALAFSATTEGAYDPTMRFLQELEDLQRFTKIGRIDFSIDGATVVEPNLQTDFEFTVFTFTGVPPQFEDFSGGDR